MKAKRWTLVAVVLGSGIVFLDSTIVPVALPRIGEELSSTLFKTLEAQNYVYYGYLLTLSALLILAGALTDYFGRRRMFTIGLLGFGATSFLCGIAPNMELLILGRVLQGAAGALLVPGSLSIITANFEGEEQGRAFGIWAGASAATTIFGPVVGGALVAYVSWRTAFLINLPLVALAVWASLRYMTESRDEEATGRFDWVGAAVAAVAVGGLTFGTIRGQAQDWQEAGAFVALAAGACATVAFPILMAHSDHPLVPLSLFKSRNFTVTNISTLLIYGSLYVLGQFSALFLIGVLGYNEIGFGMATVPATLFLVFFSTRFGALADRFGPRIFMAIGPAIMGLGMLWLTRIPSDSEPWNFELGDPSTWVPTSAYLTDILPTQILFGIGLMIMVAPLTTALMRSVPVQKSGVASAFNNAISRVGPQLAGAALFVVITGTFYAGLADRAPALDTSSERIREQVSPLNPPADEVSESVRVAAHESSTDAMHIAMLITAGMSLAGAAINGVGIRNEPRAEAPEVQPVTASPLAPPVEAPTDTAG